MTHNDYRKIRDIATQLPESAETICGWYLDLRELDCSTEQAIDYIYRYGSKTEDLILSMRRFNRKEVDFNE